MLDLLWNRLEDDLETISHDEAAEECRGLLGFIDVLIPVGGSVPLEGQIGVLQRFLDDNLETVVGVEDLCRRFNVSRSTVYERYKPYGGVDKYLMRARLDRCFNVLRYSDPATTRVSSVAEKYGFVDAAYFSRKFSSQFGLPPSKVLGLDRAQLADTNSDRPALGHPNSADYRRWFQELATDETKLGKKETNDN